MKGAVFSLLCAILIAQGRELPSGQSEKTCNCNPNEAQSICSERDSDGTLIAHEYCNKFYICANGSPVANLCAPPLLYDPVREVCEWPLIVDCGDRPIFETEPITPSPEGDNDNGDSGNGENRPCNCNPAEAPSICASQGSEGTFIAHENCNQYYVCNHGVPVSMSCGTNLLYNPYKENCDWASNVECGDRVIPEGDGGDTGGGDNGGGESNETGPETCNCNPGEAPSICATPGSDSVLIAHENCNQYYQCNHGVPVAMKCTGTLLYNPYAERCDWPNNVDCGDRVVPCDCEDENSEDCDESSENNSNETGGAGDDNGGEDDDNGDNNSGDSGGGDIGGGDNDGGDNGGGDNDGGDNEGETGGGNCDPSEAPTICATEGSDGVLVAHEKCNKYYICDHGLPVPRPCPGSLLFNPETDQCDWPENVDCGDRLVPEPEDEDNDNGDNGGEDNGGGDNGGGDNGGGDNGGGDNGNGTCNCNPGEAEGICSADDSDGILIAHENCNQFYICAHGVPVAMKCYGNLFYNPYTEQCDWQENVDCGDRVIPDSQENDSGENGGDDNDGGDNGEGDNDGGDNEGGTGGGNCDPSEALAICAAEGSDGVLVAHEKCNKYYICDHGVPVPRPCPGSLLFNPQTDQCDWPENVDCGDRLVPEPENEDNDNGGDDNSGGDNGGGDNGEGDNDGGDNEGGTGGGNCDPSEAPAICAAEGSDGVLVAHEKCNKYYICDHGVPVSRPCPGSLLFNPQTDQCDWPENVDCGDRLVPEPDNEDNDNGGDDNGGGDNGGGDNGEGDNDGGDNEGGTGGGNCDPSEAPAICAAEGSDGVLVAHEKCNKYYICDHGVPVPRPCPGSLLFNPQTDQCDWPENVDCGDRLVPEPENEDNDNGGDDNGGGDNGGGDNGEGDNDGGDNEGGTGGGNCDPSEAPAICAAEGSDGVLVAHEKCNKYYICDHGVPVPRPCPGSLLFNPQTDQCDWPENVDCGDRLVPEPDNEDNDNGGDDNGGGDNGGGDNGEGDNDGGDNEGGTGGGNCDPSEAPAICAAEGSDGVLVAHEKCNKYYICDHGVPVPRPCPGSLLFNPQTDQCDWPENVDCGDRLVPEPENEDNDNGGDDNGGGDNGGGDNGEGDNDGGDNEGGTGGGNCDPSEAPAICAAEGSDGVLVAHEKCNKYYICDHGVPVPRPCPGSLLFNPQTDQCDWPENVDCGDRLVPEPENEDNDNGGDDNGGGDNGGGDNGEGDNDGGDNEGGTGGGNCDPSEAPAICAAEGSDGVLVAHEKCNKYYICDHGVPVPRPCPGSLLFNPQTDQCDWPENVDCGDRLVPEPDNEDNDNGGDDNGGGDNGGGDNGEGDNDGGDNEGGTGGGNCDPSEAPAICAAEGSDGVLVAHEKCNKYYICDHGVPVPRPCPGSLLFNPQTDQCDWPENVDCGDRLVPEPDNEDNDNGGDDNGGGDNGGGDNGEGDNDGGDNEGGTGGGNCDPSEAPAICAAEDSDGVLVAHEKCNKYYICDHGVPVPRPCPGSLLFNPQTDQCDWPENVDCGDRLVPEPDNEDNDNGDNGGDDNGGGDNGNGDNGGGDNGGGDTGGGDNGGGDTGGGDNGNGTCNCNPGEAPGICAADGSDGVLVAHENCNEFYKCSNGLPVALKCYGDLLYNPYTEQCDWPENVDCGDRIIPDSEDSGNDNGGGDNGGSDNGGGDNGGGTCNCNPGEAPGICAADGSDGVLVAHENCNEFYKCSNGLPVALKCYGDLLYNPFTEQCDWPENVDCGDRIIPDSEDSGNDNGGGDNGGSDNGGSDNGGGDNGGGTCNCNPGEAPGICAADGSDGVLVAHENCNEFYKCSNGLPVALKCYGDLLYNPYTEQCDWPENVDCGDRIIPDSEDSGNDNGGGDNGGSDNGGGDNGGGTCNCNPGEAPGICAADGSDGVLVAHENCNEFYKCSNGLPVALKCYGDLLYNPFTEQCDWPENVDCGDRIIPDSEDSGNDNGGGDNGGSDNGGSDNGGGDNGGGTCNCNPGEAPGICAADGSDGVLVAHENCNEFYKCSNGLPVALKCYGDLLYNPYTEQCDWPENVDCGDRIIPDSEDSGNDNGGGDNGGSDNGGSDNGGGDNGGGTCNCNPGEAPGICAADGSDGVLVAHENCNEFYKCSNGLPVALKCYGDLLYNPYTEQCDWPENVDCGDRIIPDSEDSGNDNGGGDNGGSDNGGSDNGGGDNGGGTCNCNPGEAPGICAADGSDGVLVAHENCNEFYKCSNGLPVALKCYGDLLYNPYIEQCDWPENVNCSDRIIPDSENNGNNEDGDNTSEANEEEDCDESNSAEGGNTCNCDPSEAQGICAVVGSDGTHIAHEKCNQFYQCSNGQAIALYCSSPLLYNPYTKVCDWPYNVECDNRIISDTEDNNESQGNDDGGSDNGSDNGGGHSDPSKAPAICAAEGSNDILVAHENCNQFYICANGVPVTVTCNNGLLYNPALQWCDWSDNVHCGDRVIPKPDNEGETGGVDDNSSTDNGSGGGNGGHYDPSLAPEICAAPYSNNVIVAHEYCNKFYICDHGKPVTLECPNNLLYNPSIGDCDWSANVECDNRIIPEDSDNVNTPCNCEPRLAVPLCSREGSDGMLIAHENCNQFYTCLSGSAIPRSCPANLFYNPVMEACDWPSNVNCNNRVVPTSHISLNKHIQARNGLRV